ncbi:MAG: AAA family ATPase, partial [Sphaerochaetaceae bacterium]|nr:AAA family ATPase [Sphaerochaetaceae bacterium]
ELKEKLQINRINNDILKTLELMDKNNVYNNGASLIADKNSFPGIDIIRFGRNINEIRDRVTYECQSLLNQFHGAIETFKKYYVFEKITGTERTTVETIPLKAFREAIANALVHRAWDVKASILVKMFEDRIEISSPGGLPYGISKEDYINGHFSIFRNPIIGNIFFRLHYIEKFGTGIVRIKSEYNSSIRKPSFSITSEAIIVTLPILSITYNTTETEKDVLMLMESGSIMNREQISQQLDLDKSTTIRLLNKMIEKELLIKEGNGRGTKYHI